MSLARTVNLRVFLVNDTWEPVAGTLGRFMSSDFTAGSKRLKYAECGSVTCNDKLTYTVTVKGSGYGGLVNLTINGKVARLAPYLRKLGAQDLPEPSGKLPGVASQLHDIGAIGSGTRKERKLVGNVFVSFGSNGSTVIPADQLGAAGVYTDNLDYLLKF